MATKRAKLARKTKVPTSGSAGRKAAASKKAQKPARQRVPPANISISPPDEVKAVLQELSSNETAVNYLKKNVSKRAIDVIGQLSVPKTDEDLAEILGMKINAVRRILNILQGHGVTNYYVSKNVNGWLSFAWYVNVSKLRPFFTYVENVENKRPVINSECNDYFVCNSCYVDNKLIFTFDAAFESNFKCASCGNGLFMINKNAASKLAEGVSQTARELTRTTRI